MRVCPKCGHKDPPYWKQSAFHQNVSFTEFSNLEFNAPELAKRLKNSHNHRVSDDEGVYAYKLTRFMRVERQAICENLNWKKQWDIPAERSKSLSKLPKQWRNPATLYRSKIYGDKHQTKLLEVTK